MKTWMKKLTALILIALLVIGSINLTVDLQGETVSGLSISMTEASAKGKTVAPKKVTIEGSKYVAKGKKIKLKAIVAPEGANQKVTWTSSNPAVAKVDQKGNVKGIKPGKVKITAASKDNPKKKKAYTVQVMAQAVKKITISGTPETMTIGATVTLKAEPDPKKAAKSFEWKSSNTAIATVNAKGQVTAVAAGTATITATATDGSKKKSSVTITVAAPEEPVTPTEPETPVTPPDPEPQPQEKDDHTFDVKDDNGVTISLAYHKASKTVTITKVTGASSGHFTIPAEVKDSIDGASVTVSGLDDGALAGCDLNYIEVLGTTTTLAGIDNVPYVFASAGSQAATDAGSKYVQKTKVEGKFLYDVSGTTATLLCPVNNNDIPQDVVVPATVDGKPVTEVKETALGNATSVTSLSVPEGVEVPESVKSSAETFTERVLVDSITITADDEIPQEVVVGMTFTLKAEAKGKDDKDPTNAEVEWISDHPEFAKVTEENGIATVTGVSYGTATITAVAKDGSMAEATNPVSIQVWNDPTTGIVSIGTEDYENEMDQLQTQTLVPVLNPALETFKGLTWTWSSSNATAISVDENGLITANEATSESVTITATLTLNGETLTGEKATATFTVNKVYAPIESITLSPDTATLVSDHEYEIKDITTVTVLPAEARQEWTWATASNSTSVTTSENNKIIIDSTVTTKQEVEIGVQAGTKTAVLKLTVLPAPLSISISAENDVKVLNLYAPAGKNTVQLTAQVAPEDADQSVVWKSMNESIATVDADTGLVTAQTEGKVKIRATSKNDEESPYSEYDIEVVNEELIVNSNGELTAFVVPNGGATVIPAKTADGTAITAIDPELFKNNTALTKLTISASVTLIPEGLCEGCISLTEVILPDSVTSIGSNAFKGTALTELTIPGKVTAIPDRLCEGCTSLTKVTMPNCITVIGQAAFKGCTSLSSSETYDAAAE